MLTRGGGGDGGLARTYDQGADLRAAGLLLLGIGGAEAQAQPLAADRPLQVLLVVEAVAEDLVLPSLAAPGEQELVVAVALGEAGVVQGDEAAAVQRLEGGVQPVAVGEGRPGGLLGLPGGPGLPHGGADKVDVDLAGAVILLRDDLDDAAGGVQALVDQVRDVGEGQVSACIPDFTAKPRPVFFSVL